MNTSKHYNLTAFHHNLARLPAGRYPSARDDSKYLTPTPYRSMPTRTPRAVHFPASRTSPRRAASWPSCAEATSPTGPRRRYVSHRPSPEPTLPQALAGDTFPQAFAEATSFYKISPENEEKPSDGAPGAPRAAQRVARDASCGKVRRPLENHAGTENAVEQLFGLFDSLWDRIVDRDIHKRR